MARKRMKGCKYRRVSQQQKYIFLKLCITEQQSIHEAAYNAGIHYSTAKTILFFHKKNYKNYSSYHVEDPHAEHQARSDAQRASYKSITIDLDEASRQKTQIQIIVNSKADQRDAPRKKYCPMKQKTNMFSDQDFDAIKMEAGSEQLLQCPKSVSQGKVEQRRRTQVQKISADSEKKREGDIKIEMT